jgi:hypothetical protein
MGQETRRTSWNFLLLKSQVLITVPKIPISVIKRYKDITRRYGKKMSKSLD